MTQPQRALPTITATTVATLPLLATDFVQAELSTGIYTMYLVEVSYERDWHRLQLPIASTTTTDAAFCVLANPTVKRIVRWTAEKWVVPPTAPTQFTDGSQEVLLKDTITTTNIELGPDGVTPIYTVAGKYDFGVVDGSATIEYYYPTPPYVNTLTCFQIQTAFESGIDTCA